ncbi:MAG: AAA family ATPase, partial [Burkholderiaceae bacterium]
MIIVIATENGGIEKSILSNNMATLRAMDGRKVLLIDGDQQKNSYAWGRTRHEADIKPSVTTLSISAKGLQPELENLTPHYNDIVIDAEGRDCMASRSALIMAKTAIIPIRPDLLDQACEEKLIARLATARLFNPCLRVLSVMTCVGDAPS